MGDHTRFYGVLGIEPNALPRSGKHSINCAIILNPKPQHSEFLCVKLEAYFFKAWYLSHSAGQLRSQCTLPFSLVPGQMLIPLSSLAFLLTPPKADVS